MVQTIDLERNGDSSRPSPKRPDARERLIEAGGRLFAERGYDGVSTRQLAKRAKVNLSAITYHFGGKQALYRAVYQRIVADLAPVRGRLIAEVRAGIVAAAGDPAKLAAVATGLVRAIVEAVCAMEPPRWRMQLMLREVGAPSGAFDLVMAEHVAPMHDAIGALIAAATGKAEDDPRTRLMTHGVLMLCLQYGFQEPIVLRRLGWTELSPDKVEEIVAVVADSVAAMLRLPTPSYIVGPGASPMVGPGAVDVAADPGADPGGAP